MSVSGILPSCLLCDDCGWTNCARCLLLLMTETVSRLRVLKSWHISSAFSETVNVVTTNMPQSKVITTMVRSS